MKVVVVAKTRMGRGACVGGLTFDGRSVRLIPPDRDTNEQFNMEFAVGDVWDIDCSPDPHAGPPHIENIIVHHKRKLPPIEDLPAFIAYQMPPLSGGTDRLFDGLLQATRAGVSYIAERTGVPAASTQFWQPDAPLELVDDGKRLHYRYPGVDGRMLTYVGFQEPLPQIPAGALLRVSLAHWWRPTDRPDDELRCYAQLSGWYGQMWQAPPPQTTAPSRAATPAPRPARPQRQLTLEEAAAELQHTFGYDAFRPLQEEVISNVLQKKDSLAIMPTGSGKSLCYQIPALLFPGLTVVVSPLISLMQDQVEQLRDRGVAAAFLNSTLDYAAYQAATAAIRDGRTKLLYAAPETLLRPETMHLLEQVPVDCLAIDEAHCISDWGHDFRPEYRQLVDLRRRLPQAVCIATTATATARVREDIKASLSIADAAEFIASFDRPNLALVASERKSGIQQLLSFLQAHRGEAGIVYCNTKKEVDGLAAMLRRKGHAALPYHADLDDATRRANQRRFVYEEGVIIVATIAFGMGINKSNVRFIVHYGLPKNLESYYQQIGRAGRDGLPADCLLLWNYSDARTIDYFISQEPPEQQIGAVARKKAMLDFAAARRCRRVPLLHYFGEQYGQQSCAACDNCLSEERAEPAADLVDLTIPAQKFLSCVKRTRQLYGPSYIVDVLRGSRSRKVLDNGHDALSTYGIGREYNKRQWRELGDEFVAQGLLRRDGEFGSLKLTATGEAVLKQEQMVHGRAPSGRMAGTASSGRTADETSYDQELFEALRQKRAELALAGNVPPYVIFHDSSLVDMATKLPQNAAQFGRISGVGDAKLAKYAEHFLPIIRAHAEASAPEEEPLSERAAAVAEQYNEGASLAELVEQERVKLSTVRTYLWQAAQAGLPLRPEGFLQESQLDGRTQTAVFAAFNELGTTRLRPVYEHLAETVPYEELHLLRLYFVAAGQKAGA